MNTSQIRISNGHRNRKTQKYSQLNNRRKKTKTYYKNLSCCQKERMIQIMGYDYQYDYSESNIMKDLKDGFTAKCNLYYSGMRANKKGRKNKHELKQRINFQPKINPVLKMFQTLNRKLVKPTLKQGITRITEHAQTQPNYFGDR